MGDASSPDGDGALDELGDDFRRLARALVSAEAGSQASTAVPPSAGTILPGAGRQQGSDSDSDSDYTGGRVGRPNVNIVFALGRDGSADDTDMSDDDSRDGDADYCAEATRQQDIQSAVLDKLELFTSSLTDEERGTALSGAVAAAAAEEQARLITAQQKADAVAADRQANTFKRLLADKDNLGDVKYFKERLTDDERREAIAALREVRGACSADKPYRLSLLEAPIPLPEKACAYRKLSQMKSMDPASGEYYKAKTWVDTFMRIPFGKYKGLSVDQRSGPAECSGFLRDAQKTLDAAVYGLTDAKLQIMQLLAQWMTNPTSVGTAIAIQGPMGTGKTTLVKEGISKILGRDFAFIALGGATDASFLEGHAYTYEGSLWGRIVDTLVKTQSMNPVFFFDELDKVSDTPKGEEIIGVLTHLTDTSQNTKYHDKYFAELEFDLSRCLFIFSYNDESKINPILKDRMYRIKTKGYMVEEKTTIATDYLLPKAREQVGFSEGDVVFTPEVFKHITEKHTGGEQGVRTLKRCVEIIHTKLNLYRLMSPGDKLFGKDPVVVPRFPFVVTCEAADSLLAIPKDDSARVWHSMYL